jgi:hypothetical protein
MDQAWAGVDAGKEFHWAHLLWTLRAQSSSPGGSKTTRRTS